MTAYVYRGRKRDLGIDLVIANQSIMDARPALPEPQPVPVCGTYNGYQAHRRHRERACDRCRAAYTEYRREHR